MTEPHIGPQPRPIFRSPWGTIVLAVVLWAPLLWWIAGCANTGGATNPQNAVYGAAVALTAADNAAIQYVVLPLCGPTHAKPLCSEASISAQIKSAAQTAHDAVRAAEKTGDAGAAQAAVAALVAITPHQ